MNAATRAKRRAKARTLGEQGMTNRAIAKRLEVSESTVRRWRAEERAATAPEPANLVDVVHEVPASREDALTVPLDDELREHLAVLAEAGLDAQGAVALAVQLLADSYAYAWDYGLCDRGERPQVRVRIKGDRPPPGSW